MIKNVAVVGCGIGRTHIVSYVAHPDKFRVVAICDLNDERLASIGDEFGIERRTKDFAEILRMDDVDIVDVCTPPAVHLEQILAALAAGKNVVCEKPLVGSVADVDKVIQAEKQSKGRVLPIFQYRYGNGIMKAKHIIDQGIASRCSGNGPRSTTTIPGADGGKPNSAASLSPMRFTCTTFSPSSWAR
jgi:predicted dehydrogenase